MPGDQPAALDDPGISLEVPSVTKPPSTIQASSAPASSAACLASEGASNCTVLMSRRFQRMSSTRITDQALLSRRIVRQLLGLREHHQRGLCVFGMEKSRSAAPRDTCRYSAPSTRLLRAIISFCTASHFCGRQRAIHAQFGERTRQPHKVRGIVDQLSVQHGTDLVDAVGKQETAVEDGNLGIFLWQVFAIHIDGTGHGVGRPPSGRGIGRFDA